MEAEPTEFTHTTEAGSLIVCGKPQGVLKLRLRRILTPENLADNEIRSIATAFLCIKQIDGIRPMLNNVEHFEALMLRFGSDDDLDEFMGGYQKFVNPEMFAALETAAKEATAKGLMGDKMQEYIIERMREMQRERLEDTKN